MNGETKWFTRGDREELDLAFSGLVYWYNTFGELPDECISRMRETDPACAEKMAELYGALLSTLATRVRCAGQPRQATARPAPGHGKRGK